MARSGPLYASLISCRLSPSFEPGTPDLVPRFLRLVAAPVLPYMRYHTMVQSWAVVTGPDTYTILNVHTSEEAMRDTTAGAGEGHPEIAAITRRIEILNRQSGPIADYLHRSPISALRVLEAYPDLAERRPVVAIARLRIRPEVEPAPTRYATVVREVVPHVLPTAVEQAVLLAWLVSTGDDTLTAITAYASEDAKERSLETAMRRDTALGAVLSTHLRLVSLVSGPAFDLFQLASQGVAAEWGDWPER